MSFINLAYYVPTTSFNRRADDAGLYALAALNNAQTSLACRASALRTLADKGFAHRNAAFIWQEAFALYDAAKALKKSDYKPAETKAAFDGFKYIARHMVRDDRVSFSQILRNRKKLTSLTHAVVLLPIADTKKKHRDDRLMKQFRQRMKKADAHRARLQPPRP